MARSLDSLKPKNKAKVEVTGETVYVEKKPESIDSEHVMECASLEDYEKAEINETKKQFSETEKEEMAKMILSLRNENESLREENEKLKKEIEVEKTLNKTLSERPESVPENVECLLSKITELENTKSEMTKRNSELECTVHKLQEVERIQQSKIDSFQHTYTKTNYNPSFTVRGGGYRTNINGYQDWR